MKSSCVLHFGGDLIRPLGICIIVSLFAIVPLMNGATFTVTIAAPDANIPGTLRFAMNSANFNPGADTIVFTIPGTGPFVIMPDSQLPLLTDQAGVIIDGLSQAGSSAGGNPPSTANLMIVIDGTNAGAVHGIWIVSSYNTIQGLVMQNFQQDGIRIQAIPDTTQFNYIYCNLVGTDQTGSFAQGNGTNQQGLWGGIYIVCTPGAAGYAYFNIIDRNLSSCNYAEGIGIANCPPGDVAFNSVFNNYVGTDIGGTTDLGNIHDGVYIGEGAHDNVVDGNLISGNDFEGVCIVGYAEAIPPVFTYANTVANNIIGLDVSLAPLPNTYDGVSIGIYGTGIIPPWYQGGYATDNMISTNIIAHNGRNGVLVWEHFSNNANADFNPITQNSMYNNTLLGIDLADDGVTANDANDPDAGPNQEVNFPVITSAVETAGQTTISGNLDIDTDPTQAMVEVFRVSSDPSGYGEGQTYLGTANPNASGNWTVIVPGLVAGDTVTATTTDVNLNTSEFAQNFVAVTGVEENTATVPQRYELGQNHPNPFTQATAIYFALPFTSDISLRVYDLSGRVVAILADGRCAAGHHTIEWNGCDDRGRQVNPGVYICTLDAGEFSATRKMIVTR
ncbi:MAG: T9SS type A sorting domain-containing protein [bacterium]